MGTSPKQRPPGTQSPKLSSMEQLEAWRTGHDIYCDEKLVKALARRDKGRATAEDHFQLGLVNPALLEGNGILRAILNGQCEERRRVKREIKEYGPAAVRDFMRATGQLSYLRSIGVKFNCGQHRRDSSPAAPRRRRSRRAATASRAGPDDDSGEPEPEQSERLCVGCGTSIAHRAQQAKFCDESCEKRFKRLEKRILADRPQPASIDPLEVSGADEEREQRTPWRDLGDRGRPWRIFRPSLIPDGVDGEVAEVFLEDSVGRQWHGKRRMGVAQ